MGHTGGLIRIIRCVGPPQVAPESRPGGKSELSPGGSLVAEREPRRQRFAGIGSNLPLMIGVLQYVLVRRGGEGKLAEDSGDAGLAPVLALSDPGERRWSCHRAPRREWATRRSGPKRAVLSSSGVAGRRAANLGLRPRRSVVEEGRNCALRVARGALSGSRHPRRVLRCAVLLLPACLLVAT
ncbi:hypothetical protein BDY21DRAFT_351118 [Lineolata rhizophorae]|uniref:Uncharacterized protein n=1 Tax=Lineolata rhizophorae TaxID=578093 RepID=A0A6A6NTI4_9PEZI|nr:hypothetical protein BDY21DRAFT_351118 [Lineolata rhizophorae]